MAESQTQAPHSLSAILTLTLALLTSHVFVVARGFVYDPDSYLCQGNFPDELGQMRGRKSVPIREYLEASFPPPSTPGDLAGTKDLDANSSILTLIHFLPSFRLVPAADFLEHFASDRRDMLLEGQQDGEGRRWARPPPSWLPIRGGRAAEEHNLERWYNLDFHSEGYGVVLGGCDHLLAALFPHVLFACREL